VPLAYPLASLLPNEKHDQWVSQMLGLDLPARRSVLKRFRPQPIRQFLYKYFPTTGYSPANLQAALVASMLRLNPPSEFNDPSEMRAHIFVAGTEQAKRDRFEAIAREQNPLMGWRAIQAQIDALMSRTEEVFTPVWQRSLATMRENAGVCCFAGSAKNDLMWSHYAEGHRGVCLQFERVRDIATFSQALRVHYEPGLPTLNYIDHDEFARGLGRMLFSKSPDWRYERENRIFLDGQANRYLPFEASALRKLIFGCKAIPVFIASVLTMLTERTSAGLPPVEVFYTHLDARSYRLVMGRTP
jgi:hypothetical protein